MLFSPNVGFIATYIFILSKVFTLFHIRWVMLMLIHEIKTFHLKIYLSIVILYPVYDNFKVLGGYNCIV